MSFPAHSEDTRTQDSYHASSQHAVGAALEDSASSARRKGHADGSSAAESLLAPNSAFARRHSLSRGRSASLGPRQTALPLGVSVAQRRPQLVERTAESALSGVGHVTEEIRHARSIAEVAISEARCVHGEIESKVSSLVVEAAASTAHITDALSKRVGEVVAKTEAKTFARCWDGSPTTGTGNTSGCVEHRCDG